MTAMQEVSDIRLLDDSEVEFVSGGNIIADAAIGLLRGISDVFDRIDFEIGWYRCLVGPD